MSGRIVWGAATLGAFTGMALAGVALWWAWPGLKAAVVRDLLKEIKTQSPLLGGAL